MGAEMFKIGDKVLVYQGPLLYDSKIVRTFDPVTQKVQYYDEKRKELVTENPNKKFPTKLNSEVCVMVHYNGWNAKWDEWVSLERVLEMNDKNLALKESLAIKVQEEERQKEELALEEERARELEKERKRMEKEKGKDKEKDTDRGKGKIKAKNRGRPSRNVTLSIPSLSSTGKSINGSFGIGSIINTTNGKRSIDNEKDKSFADLSMISDELEQKYKRQKGTYTSESDTATHYESRTGFTHHEIKKLMPDNLKILLVDDWENITKRNKLVSIPSKVSVSKVLEDFKKFIETDFDNDTTFLEITESIKQYFEQCLGTLLLYRYERLQYKEIIENDATKNLFDVYGSIYLLRLLSIFPNVLMVNKVEPSVIKISKIYLDILLNWLDLNKEDYFIDFYENQTPWVSLING